MATMNDYTEIWQLQDVITTAVNACGYDIWDLHANDSGFLLELAEYLDDDAINLLCCQLPLVADYEGQGAHGSVFLPIQIVLFILKLIPPLLPNMQCYDK